MKKVHKIYFKNGTTQIVSHEIATAIRDAVVSGTKNYQCFSDEEGNVFLIVNLLEISHIIDIGYIKK